MNARHVSAELRRKSVAADALTALNKQLSAPVVEPTHALAAARKTLWALVGVLADADAEREASQRNPDGTYRCLSF